MNEEKFSIWALGFALGVMGTIAADKFTDMNQPPPDPEQTSLHADKVLDIYTRGKIDALTISGTRPNFELEQACLTLWATKQGESK